MTATTSNHEHATGRSRIDGPLAERPALPGRWRVLTVSLVAAFMTLLDVSIVNVALPSIERGLGASATSAQWAVSGYALAFGLALVPAGRLGDVLGRRWMFLIALSAFVVTSALSGAAPTTGLLIAARLLQGVAGGMLLPQNSGLIQELFGGGERGRAFGLLGTTVGLATAAGPVLGGLILAAIGGPDAWRWVFYVNLPIGLVALILAARLLPAAARAGRQGVHLDLIGGLLLGGGVLCLLLPVVDATDGGLTRLRPLLGLAVGLLTGFAWWEARTARRGRQPLLDPQLARTSGYAPGLAIGLVYFVGFTGIWLVLALFFQDGLGYSPLRSGLAVTPFALGVAASAVVAGRLVSPAGEAFPVGGSKVLRASDHDQVTLVGAGVTVHACLRAAEILAEEGVHARVIDCYSVKPIDTATLGAAAAATAGRIVVAEDHRPEGGLGSAVTDALLAPGRSKLAIAHLAVRELPGSGSGAELLAWAGLDADHIAAAARKLLDTA
jgi:EmrB/QacA subfamily drug resistance transporter